MVCQSFAELQGLLIAKYCRSARPEHLDSARHKRNRRAAKAKCGPFTTSAVQEVRMPRSTGMYESGHVFADTSIVLLVAGGRATDRERSGYAVLYEMTCIMIAKDRRATNVRVD